MCQDLQNEAPKISQWNTELVSGTTMTTMGQGPTRFTTEENIRKTSFLYFGDHRCDVKGASYTTDMKLDQFEDSAIQPSQKKRLCAKG